MTFRERERKGKNLRSFYQSFHLLLSPPHDDDAIIIAAGYLFALQLWGQRDFYVIYFNKHFNMEIVLIFTMYRLIFVTVDFWEWMKDASLPVLFKLNRCRSFLLLYKFHIWLRCVMIEWVYSYNAYWLPSSYTSWPLIHMNDRGFGNFSFLPDSLLFPFFENRFFQEYQWMRMFCWVNSSLESLQWKLVLKEEDSKFFLVLRLRQNHQLLQQQ